MEPILRAAADRLIHHSAYLRYVVEQMTPEELEAPCAATGYTMGETFAHCVLWLEWVEPVARKLIAEGAETFEPLDDDAMNAAARERLGSIAVPELLERMAAARDELIAAFAGATHARTVEPLGGDSIGATLLRWTTHLERHALDIAETLPGLRYDALLLDWTLSADYRDEGEAARQARLIEDVRAYLATLPEDEDEEEDDFENEAE